MKMNSKDKTPKLDDFFASPPSSLEKAWDLIGDFYETILVKMEREGISRADLAGKMGVSRAAVSQMFNKTPNVTIKKMVEIADAVGVELALSDYEAENIDYQSNKHISLEMQSDVTSENVNTPIFVFVPVVNQRSWRG